MHRVWINSIRWKLTKTNKQDAETRCFHLLGCRMPGNRLLHMSASDQYDGWPVPSSETLTNVPIEAVGASVLLLLPTGIFLSALPPAAFFGCCEDEHNIAEGCHSLIGPPICTWSTRPEKRSIHWSSFYRCISDYFQRVCDSLAKSQCRTPSHLKVTFDIPVTQ